MKQWTPSGPSESMAWVNQYAQKINEWDKTHRLVGRTNTTELVHQSCEALRTLPEELLLGDHFVVDVGAGSGIVGVPAMQLFHVLQVLFVEPDPKKTAFVRSFVFGQGNRSLADRTRIFAGRIEDVSRETGFEKKKPLLLARAFSGDKTLLDAVQSSVFAGEKLFVFRAEGHRHFFEKLC